jgi:hypothetical protein
MRRTIRLREYEPNTKFRFVPPYGYSDGCDHSFVNKGYTVRADENGFISSHDIDNPLGTLVVLGDSFAECLFMDEEKRLTSVLQDLLVGKRHLPIKVLNGGCSAATLLHTLNVFVNKVIPLHPLAVIVMSGGVDVDVAEKRASFWSKDCWLEPVIAIEDQNTINDRNIIDVPSYEDRTKLLSVFKAAGDAFGIPVWLATIPHRQVYQGDYVRERFPEEADFMREVAKLRALNRNTRTFASTNAIRLFDLESLLAAEAGIFYDMVHLNECGVEVVARKLLDCGLAEDIEARLQGSFIPPVSVVSPRQEAAIRAGRAFTIPAIWRVLSGRLRTIL